MADAELERRPGGLPKNSASVFATSALIGVQRRWRSYAKSDLDPSQVPDSARREVARHEKSAVTRDFVMPRVHLEDPEWTRAVLGLLSSSESDGRMPPVALLLKPASVEALFTTAPPTVPIPFDSRGEHCWSIPRESGTLAELPSTPTVVAASRRAGLVTGWHSKGHRLLIDIVSCGSVALDGPPIAVGATLSDVVVELALRRWSDLEELIVVGFGNELLGLERVLCLPDADRAREMLLSSTGGAGRDSERAQCVVVAPPTQRRSGDDNPLRSLIELIHALPHAGLICCDPSIELVRSTWRLEAHHHTAEVTVRRGAESPLRLIPPGGRSSESSAPDPAFEVDTEPSPRATHHHPAESHHPAERSHTPSDTRTEEVHDVRAGGPSSGGNEGLHPPVRPSVLVRVLGPVEVSGAATSLDHRPRVSELVVYLAFHSDGCVGEAIASALWPDRRVSAQTVANRLSEARQALGETADGAPRLRRVSGRHVLASDVGTDWSVFERLTGLRSTPEDWTQALALVRGRPFEGLPQGDWTVLEGLSSMMQSRIVDIACRLASHLVEQSDPSNAEWAVRRGLSAAPWDERLYRMLMVVQHAAGNRAGVELALRSLARVLDCDGDPLEGVHPETAALYRELRVSERRS